MIYEPKLSVIVPCYNVVNFLKSSIEALEEQLKNDGVFDYVEIILVDDGSQDATMELIKTLEKAYENIRSFSCVNQFGLKTNMGQAYARNIGIDNAAANWVTFLDADDYYCDHAIKTFIESIKKLDSKKCYFAMSGFAMEENGAITNTGLLNIETALYDTKLLINGLFDMVDYSLLSCIGGKLYRKDFLDKNEIRFRNEYKYNEDAGFVFEVLLKINYVYCMNIITYRYIQRLGSDMHSYRENQHKYIKKVYILLKELIIKYECYEKDDEYSLMIARLAMRSIYNTVLYSTVRNYIHLYKDIEKDTYFVNACRLVTEKKMVGYREQLSFDLFNNKHVILLYLLVKLTTKLNRITQL